MKKERILVTGGAGFIGSHVCEKLLEEDYEVINLDNFNDYYDPKIKEKNIEKALSYENYILIKGDIQDIKKLQEIFRQYPIDRVIHLAAMAGVRNSIANPMEYVDVDIKATVRLLEMSRRHNVKRFVFASSSSVYGDNKKVPFSEEDIVENQISPYATAKRCGELYCKTYHRLYGLSVGCMRFFTVYGPRQRLDMAIHKFTKNIDIGKQIPVFGHGESKRDYTYVDDIVAGIMGAMIKNYGFEIFNLGNSNTISLSDLIHLIEKTLGKKAIINRLPNQLGDVPITYADIKKSKDILGYTPKVSIQEGVKRFVRWYNS